MKKTAEQIADEVLEKTAVDYLDPSLFPDNPRHPTEARAVSSGMARRHGYNFEAGAQALKEHKGQMGMPSAGFKQMVEAEKRLKSPHILNRLKRLLMRLKVR